MKHEKHLRFLEAALLAFLLSFGAAASMATGLELNVPSLGKLALVLVCVCTAAAFTGRTRHGGWILAFAALLPAWYLLRNDTAWAQLQDALYKITRYYHRAYGWAVVESPFRGTGPMDIPVTLIGSWIGLYAAARISRGKNCADVVLFSAVPMIASVIVNDTVPHSPYLFLWLLGVVLTLLSNGVRRENPAWGSAAVLLALIPAALALGFLFRAVPREGYDKHPDELQQKIVDWFQSLPDRWEHLNEEIGERVDGVVQPESISLRSTGPRIKRVYPVMEVTAPVTGTVYLRGQHYDVYTGTGWQASEGKETFSAPDFTRELGTIAIRTRTYRDVLYLPYYPEEKLTLTDGAIDNTSRGRESTYRMRGLASHWRNILASSSYTVDQPYFAAARAENSPDVNRNLPEDTYRWAVKKADEILSGEVSATEVADAIGKYVRNSARYNLDTQKMPLENSDFAQWFLEESDTGYCVHFATAATVLLRAAGVEARYVEGYMFSARNGEEVTVTADQAHAWVEYYEPVLGTWIVLESTPADLGEPEATEAPETAAETTHQPDEETAEPTTGETRLPEETEAAPGEQEKPDGPEKKQLNLRWLRWLLLPVLMLGTLEGQRWLRIRLRHRRRGRNGQALTLWRQLERLCQALKLPAPEEARILAEKAKYSRTGISREELETMYTHLAEVRSLLRQRGPLWKIAERYLFTAE